MKTPPVICKRESLEQALHGLVGPHQRKMLATQLEHIDFLDDKIKELDQEVDERSRPFEEELELLDTIPGVGRRSAFACANLPAP
jgi:transposase